MKFNFYQPTRLHFGNGKLNDLGEIVSKHGKKCLLVTTIDEPPLKGLYDRAKSLLELSGVEVIHFDEVEPNPTVEIVETGIQLFNDNGCDVVLAVGGGSSIDTAKTIALLHETDLNWPSIFDTYDDPFVNYEPLGSVPLISVTTTAGTGSEVTQAAVITSGDEKRTIFHPDNFSTESILDPELLLTLPPRLTAATGFDAFCHAFESYVSQRGTIMSELYAMKAMAIIVDVLPKAVMEPKVIEYREDMMLAQMYAGIALANGGASAPHPLSEIIGGITHISHGEALALVFPEFIEVYSKKHGEKFEHVENLFGQSLSEGVVNLLKSIQLYKTKEDYNITEDQLNAILTCPVLSFLPFGSKEELVAVLEKAFNR